MSDYDEDAICPHGRKLNDLIEETDHCYKCQEIGDISLAHASVLDHLIEAGKDFFNFRFTYSAVSLLWAFQRFFKVGDYGPESRLAKRGYLPKDFFKK